MQHTNWAQAWLRCQYQSINWAATWENRIIAYAKTKPQISCAVTAQLISAFVFATWIVQSLYFLNPKFRASSHLLWFPSPVYVGPGRKPRRPVFWRRGSIKESRSVCIIYLQQSVLSFPEQSKMTFICVSIVHQDNISVWYIPPCPILQGVYIIFHFFL